MIQRVVVAAIAIPLLLWIGYLGGVWLWGLTAVLATLALTEYLRDEQLVPFGGLFMFLQGALLLHLLMQGQLLFWQFGFLDKILPHLQYYFSFIPLHLMLFVLLSLFSLGEQGSAASRFVRLTRVWWGFCYVSLLYPFLFLIGQFPQRHQLFGIDGGDLVLLTFAIVWVGDSLAMWVGSRLGRHKLASEISPNKTIEGLAGGLFGSILAAVAIQSIRLPTLGVGHAIAIGALASIAGQLGDLVESLWKRSIGVKDASHTIPGHGGLLDRFDSLLFAAPVIYLYLLLVLA